MECRADFVIDIMEQKTPRKYYDHIIQTLSLEI
jgi:hypothetical protein